MAGSPAYPGTPRWVKVLGAVALALTAVFLLVHLAGGGFHHHGAPTDAPPSGDIGRHQGSP